MIAQITKKIIKKAFVSSKAYLLTKSLYSGIGHILLFHRVRPKNELNRSLKDTVQAVSTEYLEWAINFFIEHNYEFISLDQLVNTLQRGRIRKKCVVVTLDDGYSDSFIYAYPIFKKYNIPFTIYITTGFVDGTAVLWWCLIKDLISERPEINFKIDNTVFKFNCSTTAEKINSFKKIHYIIYNSSENDCLEKIEQIFAPYNIDIYNKTKELVLSWEQIKQLSRDPLVTIGAHTLNHYRLTNLSESSARREILESKNRLEFYINSKVNHFSYPFGAKKEAEKREARLVKECGFKTGATTREANIFFAHRNHLKTLPRITMGEKMDNQKLIFLVNGLSHCITNRFKRTVTF